MHGTGLGYARLDNYNVTTEAETEAQRPKWTMELRAESTYQHAAFGDGSLFVTGHFTNRANLGRLTVRAQNPYTVESFVGALNPSTGATSGSKSSPDLNRE